MSGTHDYTQVFELSAIEDDTGNGVILPFRPAAISAHHLPADIAARFMAGDSILDAPSVPPAIWGDGDEILWAEGQSMIIAGHDGTGKTTLAGNLVKARLGLADEVLGLHVTPGRRNVLVLMMDRPRQAAARLAQLFTEDDRATLKSRLLIWPGPPPEDLAEDTGLLARMCQYANADTCVIDSLKDAAMNLTEDRGGAGWNRARQAAIVSGTELIELHHPRKPPAESAGKPPELADLYGSRWIPAGIGSAVVLHGNAGDPVVKLYHRKPIVSLVGPWDVVIGQDGTVTRDEGGEVDLVAEVRARGAQGLTVGEAATLLADPGARIRPAHREAARRKLRKLTGTPEAPGPLIEHPGQRGGQSKTEAAWFLRSTDTQTRLFE